MNTIATYVLIPAAGQGARFSTSGNKVFSPLGGRPMLAWTVEAFAERADIDGIVIVTGAEDISQCRAAVAGIGKVQAIVAGGPTRQQSVYLGLNALIAKLDDIVLVHDGARPLVAQAVIDRCIEGAKRLGNAVAAVPVVDTLKEANAQAVVMRTVPRDGIWAIQTPQAFVFDALQNAYEAAMLAQFEGTDEASLFEHLGEPVNLVHGASDNLKITRAEDTALAESILQFRQSDVMSIPRVGFGYDIHRLASGRRLVLGGVEFVTVDGRGLDGHSDADVLLHAICDALLGAAAMPDIGNLFPNTDPEFAGIDSTKLLANVGGRLKADGYRVINIDATLIAESPKIGPHVNDMRSIISRCLGIEPGQVGIKATTNEGIGAIGQGEGIAAHAVASIVRQ